MLPEAEEVDIQIRPEDLRIDIFHAGGAGGQNVNKVATAVADHSPTLGHSGRVPGRAAPSSATRTRRWRWSAPVCSSARPLQQQQETSSTRRAQVGTGERSEKVRTYNFPQDRVTDHRIGLTLHGLESILDGALDSHRGKR